MDAARRRVGIDDRPTKRYLEANRGTWAFDFRRKKKNLKPKTAPPPLFLHSMVYGSVNKVTLLFGGQTGNYSAGRTVNETWAYHHAENRWEKGAGAA